VHSNAGMVCLPVNIEISMVLNFKYSLLPFERTEQEAMFAQKVIITNLVATQNVK
jgi:hypothetical protein